MKTPRPDFKKIVDTLRGNRRYKSLSEQTGIPEMRLLSYTQGIIPKGNFRKKIIDEFNKKTDFYLPYVGDSELRIIE